MALAIFRAQTPQTGTDWSGEGEALAGVLQGQRLKRLDGYVVEWHVWSAYHSHTEVADVPNVATSVMPVNLSFPSLSLAGLDGRVRLLTLTLCYKRCL